MESARRFSTTSTCRTRFRSTVDPRCRLIPPSTSRCVSICSRSPRTADSRSDCPTTRDTRGCARLTDTQVPDESRRTARSVWGEAVSMPWLRSRNSGVTLDTLMLLRECLAGQVLQVGSPGFEMQARRAANALAELDLAIAAAMEDVELGGALGR